MAFAGQTMGEAQDTARLLRELERIAVALEKIANEGVKLTPEAIRALERVIDG